MKMMRSAGRRGNGSRALLLCAPALAMLAGCDRKPGGQVVAVVNSDDITQLEVRAEAEAAGVQPGTDFQSYAGPMLDRVIQRNLLADYAKSKNLDRGPEFVARRRQIEQALLANMAMKQVVAALPPVTPSEVNAFIQQNPANFAGRERLALDQVRFPAPANAATIKALVALGSLDAVVAKLRADGVPVQRGKTTTDTGSLEPAVARQFAGLPEGKLFDLTINGTTYISTVTGRTPVAAPAGGWAPMATAELQRQRAQKAIIDEVAKLRGAAKITYDPAFKPGAGKP